MSNHDDYHKRPGLSASELKAMDQGWREYEAVYVTRTKPYKQTPAKELGSLIHTLVLEPETFGKYAVMPAKHASYIDTVDELKALCKSLNIATKSTWRKGDYITALVDADPSLQADLWVCVIENWAADNQGKQIVSAEHYEIAGGVIESLQNDPMARDILGQGGLREHALYWDDVSGLRCKMLADLLQSERVIDVKTTRNARQRSFAHDAYNMGYHLQAAHYLTGAWANQHCPQTDFVFVAVETTVPYRVRCYVYDAASLEWAFSRRRDLIEEFKARKAANNWIEGDDGEGRLSVMSLPAWRIQDEVNWDELNEVDE